MFKYQDMAKIMREIENVSVSLNSYESPATKPNDQEKKSSNENKSLEKLQDYMGD